MSQDPHSEGPIVPLKLLMADEPPESEGHLPARVLLPQTGELNPYPLLQGEERIWSDQQQSRTKQCGNSKNFAAKQPHGRTGSKGGDSLEPTGISK